ncbi:MAG: inositol monophosphatase [Desulfobacterales bacterium]|nr:inositol monophosphatase [Desulfobacterales bacterium]
MDFGKIKSTGIQAAHQGAAVLMDKLGRLSEISKKGVIDLVTDADTASEKAILESIQKTFPTHSILAEESGLSQGTSPYQWIIDPLDGTTNFAHSLGLFAVSIACAKDDEIICGVVFNPATAELFSAIKGAGAELNGRPIQVSRTAEITDSLLVTGFPYNVREILDQVTTRLARCLAVSQGVRRLGSAALDLCYLACGRFEGFWEQNLKPWDTAAGLLIAREAGARVTDFADRTYHIDMSQLLATNGKIHSQMLELISPEDGR